MAVVYRHIRLDKNVPFYIGIGDEKRPYQKRKRNKYWTHIVNQTEYRVDILFDDLTWEEACEKEKELIKLYGRKDLGKGTLVNMTDGGDGSYGLVVSAETRKKLSQFRHTEETKQIIRQKFLGRKSKPHTEQTKEKIRQSKLGKKPSQETKDKIRQSKLGKAGKKLTEETKQKLREIKQKTIKPYYTESKSCWRVRFRRRPLRIDLGYFKTEQEAWNAIEEWKKNNEKVLPQ
jgi:hypothetical protein